MARFGNANEHADWETAHHVFTYANALDQLIKRIGSDSDSDITVVRGVLQGAMAVYLHAISMCRLPAAHAQLSRDLGAETQRSFNKIDHMCRCVDCEWVLRKARPRRYIPCHLASHFELMIGRRGEQ